MDWPQHGRTVGSSRCISGGPCHPHGEAREILTVGQRHHSCHGHVSVQAGKQGAERDADTYLKRLDTLNLKLLHLCLWMSWGFLSGYVNDFIS